MGQLLSVQFTEEMKGFVAFGETTYQRGYEQGRAAGTALAFRLTIHVEDIDQFLSSPAHEAKVVGSVCCDRLGGRWPVDRGSFCLFVDTADRNSKKMLYRLVFRDDQGRPHTLSGYKQIQDNVGPTVWSDTTTLYTNLYAGEVAATGESAATVEAAGILYLPLSEFLKQLTTFRAYGPTFGDRVCALERFGKHFLGSLWEVYGPSLMPSMNAFEREIPLYTTEGVPDAEVTTHPFSTGDRLGLSLLRFLREPCDDVVVIIHGLTTSSDMFMMPEHYNLVRYLLDHGFTDVWTFDFRMSNRFGYNLRRHRYSMDDIALYDYPPAFARVRECVGDGRNVHVICHCLGSVSFMMSLFGKLVHGVRSVVANSVALTPRVPFWSKCKLMFGPFLTEYVAGIEYLNPYWRRSPGLSVGRVFATVNSFLHRECNVPECHMLSFMWGTGWPALYSHDKLLDVTHRRGGDLYGGTSMHYYRHVRKMVFANNTAVKYNPKDPRYKALPDNYLTYAGEIETPVLFMTGENNNVFRDSNIVCHERLEKIVPGRHSRHVFPGYGHQDVFMGKDVATEVFPRILEHLDRYRNPSTQRTTSA
jgi:cholesterol oxidase